MLNLGLPAPIDIQVSGFDLKRTFDSATRLALQLRAVPGVADVYIPQDIDYPALRLNIDRARAIELGLDQKEVVQNVITALNSNQMIAPSYWIDPKNGNDYMLTVQYAEKQVKTVDDLRALPLRGEANTLSSRLDAIASINKLVAPTEVDHYQLGRVIDVYVRPEGEDLGRIADAVSDITGKLKLPANTEVDIRGMVQNMRTSSIASRLGSACR